MDNFKVFRDVYDRLTSEEKYDLEEGFLVFWMRSINHTDGGTQLIAYFAENVPYLVS